ncbi:hypothetical protein BGY98DRAFT_1049632 [Russula aff. rugulosa BPL654]|nr:hypothetical protein BGY98DRAFT_1049632 [Russula aff. rugulosa BPL654]
MFRVIRVFGLFFACAQLCIVIRADRAALLTRALLHCSLASSAYSNTNVDNMDDGWGRHSYHNFFTKSMYERPINGKYIRNVSIPRFIGCFIQAKISFTSPPSNNLHLHATSGSVTAEVWVRHDESPNMSVSLKLGSNNGSVCAIVHNSPPKAETAVHAQPRASI